MVRRAVRAILEEFSISITEIVIENQYTYLMEHQQIYLPYILGRLEKWGYTCSHTDKVTDDIVMTKFEPKVTDEWFE
jgi:hypothetical protein